MSFTYLQLKDAIKAYETTTDSVNTVGINEQKKLLQDQLDKLDSE